MFFYFSYYLTIFLKYMVPNPGSGELDVFLRNMVPNPGSGGPGELEVLEVLES
jgi:hypothetical protein